MSEGNKNVKGIIDHLNTFISQTGNYLQGEEKNNTWESDNPKDFLPKKNLKCIEQILMAKGQLLKDLMRLQEKLENSEKDEENKRELTRLYAEELGKLIKNEK